MDDLNRTFILGNLTRDLELRYTEEGTAYTELIIAANKRWKNPGGESRDSVEFIKVTCWSALAENCANSIHKGDRIMAVGHIRYREKKEEEHFSGVSLIADAVAASLEFNQLVLANG
ncbi:MAG: single-stranded DNA-binding protein [Actinomycetia bacterium]|nr:single-stranded DNA-binding protein [Actinomycetes bacterium]